MSNYFAKNLKYLREKKHIDQEKLAEDLNVPRSTLSCWENGIRTPRIEQIVDIADYFNVNMDIISRDYNLENNSAPFDELEILFSKHKDILSESDKNIIKTIIEERKKAIDKELGEE